MKTVLKISDKKLLKTALQQSRPDNLQTALTEADLRLLRVAVTKVDDYWIFTNNSKVKKLFQSHPNLLKTALRDGDKNFLALALTQVGFGTIGFVYQIEWYPCMNHGKSGLVYLTKYATLSMFVVWTIKIVLFEGT